MAGELVLGTAKLLGAATRGKRPVLEVVSGLGLKGAKSPYSCGFLNGVLRISSGRNM